MATLSAESSARLRLLNFPLIIGVVYIHSFPATIEYDGVNLGLEKLDFFTDFVRILISQGLARMAVPMFFLMSGYFFFFGFNWSWRGFGQKLATRAKTLLLPYLFWTIFVVAIRCLGQSIPMLKAYFPGGILPASASVFELANTIFGFTGPPEAYHFWFIRDLMLLMLLSPLIVLLLRYMAWLFLGGVFWAWISVGWPIYAPDAVAVLFFSLGGYLAMKGESLFQLDRYGMYFVIAYIPVLVADVIWFDASFNNYLHRCGIVVGLVATLFLSKFAVTDHRIKNILLRLSKSSFFVYAAHVPLLGLARTVAFQRLPLELPGVMLLTYLIVPSVVVAGLVALHAGLEAYLPLPLKVVTGGR